MNRIAVFLALGGVLLSSAAVMAQSDTARRDSPSSLRCSALEDLDEAARSSAIHYLAGYNDGERDAMSFATVTPGSENAAGAETSEDTPATPGGPPAAILPTLAVDAVLAACAQSPDSRIVDIITAQGAANPG